MLHRLRQVRATLRGGDPAAPAPLAEAPRTAALFAALPAGDRRHLIAVHRGCLAAGLPAEAAIAGLLHDIGKTSLSGRSPTLADRSLRVVLRRFAGGLLERISDEPAGGLRLGLHLAERHAALGAGRLAALGWPPAVVDLVRRHEGDAGHDNALATLRRIDDETV